ncbi:MAG: hypothetical protein WD042_16605 [Phycisphaeraceae bacterium]
MGASLIYLISAALILLGLGEVLDPIYDDPSVAGEKFLALATLSGYELLLLGVALLIVLWKQVTDDAVSLTILVAAFLVGCATAIDVVAPDYSRSALFIGFAGIVMAAFNLFSLRRWLIDRFTPLQWAVLGVLLGWNFLMPGIIGLSMGTRRIGPELVPLWYVGFYMTLAGAALLWFAALRQRLGHISMRDFGKVFLRSASMRWLFVTVVMLATFGHQYALIWAFNLPLLVGDFLPAMVLTTLIGLEITFGYGRRRWWLMALIIVVPMVAGAWIWGAQALSQRWAWTWGLVGQPAVAMLLLTIGLTVTAWRRRSLMVAAMSAAALVESATFLLWDTRVIVEINRGWLWVAASFLVLALGAAVSLTKDRWLTRPRPETPQVIVS